MKKGSSWILGYLLTIGGALLAVYLGSRTVTAVSEQIPVPRQHCIIIDPGHGGVDGGASSCTGKPESSYNLEISLKLENIMHLLGYQTRMIRKTDESVYTSGSTIAEKKRSDLKERVRIVNNTDGGILISIHQNQFADSRYYGAQVFYADTPGSLPLAELLQKNLASALKPPTRRRAGKCSGIYLMDHIYTTGILLECGFLSNHQEEMRLSDPAYQKKLCCVIAASVGQFLG